MSIWYIVSVVAAAYTAVALLTFIVLFFVKEMEFVSGEMKGAYSEMKDGRFTYPTFVFYAIVNVSAFWPFWLGRIAWMWLSMHYTVYFKYRDVTRRGFVPYSLTEPRTEIGEKADLFLYRSAMKDSYIVLKEESPYTIHNAKIHYLVGWQSSNA